MRRHAAGVLLPVVPLALAACSPDWYAADADREVLRLLEDYDARVLEDRADWIVQPRPAETDTESVSGPEQDEVAVSDAPLPEAPSAADQPAGEAPAAEPPPAGPVMAIDLPTALELAVQSSRDYKDRRETLYLQGLGYTLTRYDFGPILNATIGYLWSDAEDGLADDSLRTTVGATTILPTGGDLSVSGTASGLDFDDPDLLSFGGDRGYTSSASAAISQPLLRGAGYEVSHEPLTQAERDLVYEVRDFELFREDFSIRVAADFYGLVSLQTQLENDRQNYEDAAFDHQRARVLRQLDRIPDGDVFLARRREIDAEDRLLVSRTDYELALDDFKILLGIPTSTILEIRPDEPLFAPVRLDPDSAVAAAHHNRLDLLTLRGVSEDAERRVRVAANGLLPDLDLSLAYGYDGAGDALRRALPDRWTASVGATLELPVDRQSERNAYRASLISRERARRNLERRLDEVERDILNQLRGLTRLEKQIELQQEQIREDSRAVAITQIRYESGDAAARDLLEARQSVTDAQNELIDLKVRHFIARLQLRRDTGVLFIDEKGMWQ